MATDGNSRSKCEEKHQSRCQRLSSNLRRIGYQRGKFRFIAEENRR